MSSVVHSPLFAANPACLAADAFIGAHGALAAAGVVPCAAMMMITTMPISVT